MTLGIGRRVRLARHSEAPMYPRVRRSQVPRDAMRLFDDLPSSEELAPTPAPASEPATEPGTKHLWRPTIERPREVDHATTLTKIAAHIGNPAKFKKAAQLALALMRAVRSSAGTARRSPSTNAMGPRRARGDPGLRFEYRSFDAKEATRRTKCSTPSTRRGWRCGCSTSAWSTTCHGR